MIDNFRYIKDFDITAIKQHIESLTNEWLNDQSRQILFKVHRNTNSIIVTNFPLYWEGVDYPMTFEKTKTFDLVKPIIDDLECILDGKVGRSLFAKLFAHSTIPLHPDGGYYLGSAYRCHIPIVTNDQVIFTVGNETMCMEIGKCFVINNNTLHGVVNESDTDRIHLIVDIIPSHAFKG
jgi:aspartyl/asparaginyl beta-hydroxylase (cupin superfamily)